jgi:hypothetical protein
MSDDGGRRSVGLGSEMPEAMTDRAEQIAFVCLNQEVNERPVERAQRELFRRRIAVVKVEGACASCVPAVHATTTEGDDQIELSACAPSLLGSVGGRVACTLVTDHPNA